MGTATAPYREAIDHLPDGATLTFHGVSWVEYERLLLELTDRPRLRISYDAGRLEIMSPLPEHEEYARFIDAFVRICAERDRLEVQSYGGATWKRSTLARGAEPDACYVANAARVIGKRRLDLDVDPPPPLNTISTQPRTPGGTSTSCTGAKPIVFVAVAARRT